MPCDISHSLFVPATVFPLRLVSCSALSCRTFYPCIQTGVILFLSMQKAMRPLLIIEGTERAGGGGERGSCLGNCSAFCHCAMQIKRRLYTVAAYAAMAPAALLKLPGMGAGSCPRWLHFSVLELSFISQDGCNKTRIRFRVYCDVQLRMKYGCFIVGYHYIYISYCLYFDFRHR